jgi:hypothetical protein
MCYVSRSGKALEKFRASYFHVLRNVKDKLAPHSTIHVTIYVIGKVRHAN